MIKIILNKKEINYKNLFILDKEYYFNHNDKEFYIKKKITSIYLKNKIQNKIKVEILIDIRIVFNYFLK